MTPEAELALIQAAARRAGEIAMGHFRRSPEVWWKEGNSPVSQADFEVDRFLKETLLGARPDYGWLSEETADTAERLSARRTFVVDPIDGTRAFINGRTTWCVSVAIVENGRTLAGVLDCPAKNEIYAAMFGGGAVRNGERIRVRQSQDRLTVAGPKALLDAVPEVLRERIDPHGYIPSLAYRVAMVASSAIDATFVKANAHDWDIAAADLILAEAGGQLLDRNGKRPLFAREEVKHGPLVAGNGRVLDEMVAVLAQSAD